MAPGLKRLICDRQQSAAIHRQICGCEKVTIVTLDNLDQLAGKAI